MNQIKVLAIIPARGGSKGVPRKNIREINSVPLIGYTINAALESNCLTDVVVSTDDIEIADISKKFGAQVPFLRPENLASDSAQSEPVVRHALRFMESEKNIKYDAVLMLQPTSPLRSSEHIRDCVELFTLQKCDSVVSVVSVGGEHPFRMKRLIKGRLINYIDQGFWDMRPRQDLPDVYIRNGAVYLIDRDVLMQERQLIGRDCLGYEMGDLESINIDSMLDLKLAEILLTEELEK